MSYQTRKKKDSLDLRADLYSAIATMDKLSSHFDKGMVEETLYRRQLKSAISTVFKAQHELEQDGFDINQFIEENSLESKFPNGMKRLNLMEGLESDEETTLSLDTLKKLPEKTADFVAHSIELIDLLRLKSLARVELIVPLLDELYNVVLKFPTMGSEHWTAVEIRGWRDVLVDEPPSKVLSEEDVERLEFEVSRWLNEFRTNIKNLEV